MTSAREERPRSVGGMRPGPAGGYTLIPAKAILAAWWAYRADFIEYRDLRVWLACHELVARRQCLAKGRVPRYTLDELRKLVGGPGGEQLQASVSRLRQVGLLRWSESRIEFGGSDGTLCCSHIDELEDALRRLENGDRRVPFPRRLLRQLARTHRPSVCGTLLAIHLRCAYLKAGAWSGRGRCSSGWVATTFGLDERSVKAARGLLLATGVISREARDPHWAANRWGAAIVLHPERALPCNVESEHPSPEPPPRDERSPTEPPPPMKTEISVRDGSTHQNSLGATREPGRDGVRARTGRGDDHHGNSGHARQTAREHPRPQTTPKPQRALGHVELADLRDPGRLEALWRHAVAAGLMPGGEASRLRFFAAAARALRVAGARDRAALFAGIVRKGLWSNISQRDEDVARSMQAAASRETPKVPSNVQGSGPLRDTPLHAADLTDIASIRRIIEESLGLDAC